jgi:hypothetical protein
MSVKVDWDNPEKTTLRYQFEGHWTWAEFRAALNQVIATLDTAEHSIDMIADMTASKGIPPGVFTHVQQVAEMAHPKAGLTVFVGMGMLLEAFANAFQRIYPKSAAKYKFAFAHTLDDARGLLQTRRQKTDVPVET